MKKILVAGLLILSAFSLSGCFSLSNELSDRAIVGALGIDYDDGRYLVTVLCFNTSLAESEQVMFDVEFITGAGADLHAAFEEVNRATSKNLFYGHNTVLVLGRTLAEQKMLDAAIYLVQNKEARLNINVFMADKEAASLLRLNVVDKAHISGALEKLAGEAPGGMDVKVQLFQLMQRAPEGGVKGILPVVSAVEVERKTAADTEEETQYDLAVNSIVVIDQSTLCCEIAGDVMTGVMLIQNRVQALNLTVQTGQGEAYALLTRPKTQISIDGSSQSAVFNCIGAVTVRGKSNIEDSTSTAELKWLFEQECARIIGYGYRMVTMGYGVDLFDMEWYLAQELSVVAAREVWEAGGPEARAVCGFSIS